MTETELNRLFARKAGMHFDEPFTANETEAAGRIKGPENDKDERSFASYSGIDDITALVWWLIDHPKASAILGRWSLGIESPDPDDIVGLERFDPPTGIRSAVESFETSGDKDTGYSADWSFG